jgi:hypothetical protein
MLSTGSHVDGHGASVGIGHAQHPSPAAHSLFRVQSAPAPLPPASTLVPASVDVVLASPLPASSKHEDGGNTVPGDHTPAEQPRKPQSMHGSGHWL